MPPSLRQFLPFARQKKDILHIALAGHVDHGKSTLIGRLLIETNSLPPDKREELKKVSREFGPETELAFLTDQLKEERQRNITIETSEIILKTPRRDYGLIDNPGHVEFIKNMLTGSSRADAAILIIDVQEGTKDQTFRHSYLLKFLNIQNLIVVLNKMDLIGYEKKAYRQVSQEITAALESLGLEAMHLIPVCARHGENISRPSTAMPWYHGPFLLQALQDLKPPIRTDSQQLRLPVQDILQQDGKNFILGQIVSGMLTEGQEVRIFPGLQQTRISEIHVYPDREYKAFPLQNVALILDPDVYLQRGSMIVDTNTPVQATDCLTGSIFWMSPQPLKKDSTLNLRCATQNVQVRVEAIRQRIDPGNLQILEEDSNEISNNQAGIVIFRTQNPCLTGNYAELPELGRFVLEHGHLVLGAGIILEHHEN